MTRFDRVVCSVEGTQAMTVLPEMFVHRDVIDSCEMQGCDTLMPGFNTTLVFDLDAVLIQGYRASVA